jgi:hypothetical protein
MALNHNAAPSSWQSLSTGCRPARRDALQLTSPEPMFNITLFRVETFYKAFLSSDVGLFQRFLMCVCPCSTHWNPRSQHRYDQGLRLRQRDHWDQLTHGSLAPGKCFTSLVPYIKVRYQSLAYAPEFIRHAYIS